MRQREREREREIVSPITLTSIQAHDRTTQNKPCSGSLMHTGDKKRSSVLVVIRHAGRSARPDRGSEPGEARPLLCLGVRLHAPLFITAFNELQPKGLSVVVLAKQTRDSQRLKSP